MRFLLAIIALVFASTNKDLYECDPSISEYCVFISQTPGTTLDGNTVVDGFKDITDFRALVADAQGQTNMKSNPSPQPWSEGDQLIASDVAATDQQWANSIAFAMVAPLRNMMMFTPEQLVNDEAKWNKYTKAFTDCLIKVEDTDVISGTGGTVTAFGTDTVYGILGNPTGSINPILQYLEEAAIELVCLMSDLTTYDGCAHQRANWAEMSGDNEGEIVQCDCWMDGYKEIFGQDPNVMSGQFATCTPLTAEEPTDAPEETDAPMDYECGASMEECNTNYMSAMETSVSQPMVTYADVECVVPTDYAFTQVTGGLTFEEGESMCIADGQYVMVKDGKTYPTCVSYGESGDACDTEMYVCGDSDNGINGWYGQQRARLEVAANRNDYMHEECPTRDCAALNGWWTDLLMARNSGVTTSMAQNVCVSLDGTVYYVETDAMYNTCVGFNGDNGAQNVACTTSSYICGGNDGAGTLTFGWPGQQMDTLARALEGNNYMHPQCPVNVC